MFKAIENSSFAEKAKRNCFVVLDIEIMDFKRSYCILQFASIIVFLSKILLVILFLGTDMSMGIFFIVYWFYFFFWRLLELIFFFILILWFLSLISFLFHFFFNSVCNRLIDNVWQKISENLRKNLNIYKFNKLMI